MTREIKFRAFVPKGYKRWRSDKGHMLSWDDLVEDIQSELNSTKSVLGSLWYEKDPAPIFMQYTGLKDRNGTEIYEGDILNYDQDGFYGGLKCVVEWVESGFYCHRHIPVSAMLETEPEVIGNVHQNPELLPANENNHD